MAEPITLTNTFLNELFRLCFLKKPVLEVVTVHLKYTYVEDSLIPYKHILKSITSYYKTNEKLPTIGYVSQQFATNPQVQIVLAEIKDTPIPDVETTIRQLEQYIKNVKFLQLNEQVANLYNDGKKEEAVKLSAEESQEIINFSLKQGTSQFIRLFRDFSTIMKERQIAKDAGEFDGEKIPFGIEPLDIITAGGLDKGDTALLIARSGVGKSTFLKGCAIYGARLGYKVLHIQLESSRDECFTKYTQAWTAMSFNDVRFGNLDKALELKLDKIINDMLRMQKDVYIYAFEKFDEASCVEVRDLIVDFEKERGEMPHLVVIDYLGLLHPGDGVKYGVDTQSIKMKKQNVAKRLKNICTEFGTRIITADQVDNVPIETWNSPDRVITRNNLSGDKNLIDPFSYVFTLNQTNDEYKDNLIRIYCDKLRNYKAQQILRVATDYAHGRFFDRKRTQILFGNGSEENN